MFGSIFSLVFGLIIPLLRHGSSLGMPFSGSGHWAVWPWLAGLAVIAWALLHPASLVLLEKPWMKFAQAAQWINTRIIMLLLFYVMILPIGLLLRLFGKDTMHRKFDSKTNTYRIRHEVQDKSHMEKPF